MKIDTEVKITQETITKLIQKYANRLIHVSPVVRQAKILAYRQGINDIVDLTFKEFAVKDAEDEFIEKKLTGVL